MPKTPNSLSPFEQVQASAQLILHALALGNVDTGQYEKLDPAVLVTHWPDHHVDDDDFARGGAG
jgi:hypothetical protein